MISKRNKGHFLWKPMEQVENFVKLNIHRLRPNFEIGSLAGRNI
jgi:hypothetical protein